jgi:hypothetical protein
VALIGIIVASAFCCIFLVVLGKLKEGEEEEKHQKNARRIQTEYPFPCHRLQPSLRPTRFVNDAEIKAPTVATKICSFRRSRHHRPTSTFHQCPHHRLAMELQVHL